MEPILQGSATYHAPPVFNDPDFQGLQPHEQAQVLGSLYPTFNTLPPQDQAGILTSIQNTYNPDNQQNSLAGFFNALNTTNNQAPQYTSQPNLTTQSIAPVSRNPQSPVGGLQQIPIQTPVNHPLVSLLNQTVPQTGNNLAQSMQKGTLLASTGQKAQGGPFTNLPNLKNTVQQPASNPNWKAQIQMLGQKYDQLNQMANNSALDAQTRQNAKAAGVQLQNIYRQLNQQNARAVNRNMPKQQQAFTGAMQTSQQASLWQQLKAGNVLPDDDMRQLFQSLQKKGNSAAEQRQANLLRLYAVQKLAENTLTNANRAQNGDVLIQGIPVRPQDALYFAKQDIQHFMDTQTHLNPSQLLSENAPLKAGIQYQAPTIDSQGTVPSQSIYLPAQKALDLITQGDIAGFKLARLSKYYTWGDFFKTENPKEAEIGPMQNAAKLAQVLDQLSDRMGGKVGISSWHRTKAHQIKLYQERGKPAPLGSRHIFGDGIDIAGTRAYQQQVYSIARSMKEIRRIGYSTMPSLNILHLDLKNDSPANTQVVFHDNGKHGSNNFLNFPLLGKAQLINFGH